MTGSVRFDRAAEYYDRTRAIPTEELGATIDQLVGAIRGRGRCLEIGVGTGILALELHRRGVPMAGVDLSAPMLAKLIEKSSGEQPFPVVIGDVRALPFADHTFGAGLARWVFHLVPGWEAAVDELTRVVCPGGMILVNLGAFARYGATVRLLDPIHSRDDTTVGEFIDEMRHGRHSWTWRVDAAVRERIIPDIQAWAVQRFGSLDEPLERDLEVVWRAYDLPR